MTAPLSSQPGPIRFGQPSGASGATPGFGRNGAFAGVALVAIVVGGLIWAAASGNVATAQHPRLFGGSLVLEDQRPLTVIDLATARVTVRLQGIDTQVGADNYGDVQAVPVSGATMLVDRKTGTFNILGRDNYVLDAAGPGVGLGSLAGASSASAIAAGSGAYIVRYGPRSTVSLVDRSTVAAGAKLESASATPAPTAPAVTPKGFHDMGGPVADQAGSAAADTATGDLWVLAGTAAGCDVVQLHPVPIGHLGLLPTTRASFSIPCQRAAVESIPGTIAVFAPGHVRLFTASGPGSGRDVKLPGTDAATGFLPVTGTSRELWVLVKSPLGWSVAGIDSAGRVTRPSILGRLRADSLPAEPAVSGGVLYTLDRAASGQPQLWEVLPATGTMLPVHGEASYPARDATEKANFGQAQVLVSGPRVVFNNPGSLLAVVVFTDGSHLPVVVDKSLAVAVSATGPADLNLTSPTTAPGSTTPTTSSASKPVPVVQPVSQQVTCANTTQKPYAPQVTSVNVSSGTALIAWSYQLLDQTDCEPDSWSVKVTALSSSHQPDQPVQTVDGQNQILFAGLRPATTYQAVVTAHINAQSTPSSPATFTTSARGPDAPTSVTTSSDGKGDWVVSWTPCVAANCYVPADNWSVTGSACGPSYVGQPPTVEVPGSQTTVTINADSLGLLGNSLSFSVQGSLVSGLTGDPASDHGCTQAWRPPDPAAIALKGSGVASGQTITATLQVSTWTPPVEAFGSLATEFVYTVGGVTVGPTTATSITVPNLVAGQSYTPTVVVYPAGHPQASLNVTGAPFHENLAWPADLALHVGSAITPDNPNQAALTFSFPGLPPGPMTADGTVTCSAGTGGGSSTVSIPPSPLTNGVLVATEDANGIGTGCNASMALTDTANPSPYGPTKSPVLTFGPFDFGPQMQLDQSFSATYGQTTCSDPLGISCEYPVTVSYKGPPAGAEPPAGINWNVSVVGTFAGNKVCNAPSKSSPTPQFPVTLVLSCDFKSLSNVVATVTWTYLGIAAPNPWSGSPSTPPPPPPPTTSTTSTTSTTAPSTPCLTTTTKVATTTSPTTACVASASATGPSATQLASSERPVAGAGASDPQVRNVFGAALMVVFVASFVRLAAAGHRRRALRKGQRRRRKAVR